MTGSFVNHMLSGHVGGPTPVVGMGVTELMWTDRHAGTIHRVSPSGKTVWFSNDTVGGWDHDYGRDFTPNPTAPMKVARLTKRGWTSGGTRVRVGDRSEYRDPSF